MPTQTPTRQPTARTDFKSVEAWLQLCQTPFLWQLTPSFPASIAFSGSAADARQKRQYEFEAGRRSAESLLKQLGCPQQVWVNEDRSPAWPDSYTGSISHSQSWTWTAVGQSTSIGSIGIDTESIVTDATREQIRHDIATDIEWKTAQDSGLNPNQIFTVVFSAKESFYKCWYPLTRTYFGFEDAIVESASPSSLRIRMANTNPNFGSEPNSLEVFFLTTASDVFTFTFMEQS